MAKKNHKDMNVRIILLLRPRFTKVSGTGLNLSIKMLLYKKI